ncbi:MAG TPA: hypothetical protein VHX14_16460, partial [Thermoanaerobaculia bacterium]|nr:hypothetical protein [Thermoanaerobaculia bacterium]
MAAGDTIRGWVVKNDRKRYQSIRADGSNDGRCFSREAVSNLDSLSLSKVDLTPFGKCGQIQSARVLADDRR